MIEGERFNNFFSNIAMDCTKIESLDAHRRFVVRHRRIEQSFRDTK